MLTQCPHCQTLFRVGPKHLKVAAGRVRCCRCHQVFDALESLREAPSPFANSTLAAVTEPDAFEDSETGNRAVAAWSDKSLPGPDVERDWAAVEPPPQEDDFKPMLPEFAAEEPADDFFNDILEQDDGLDPEPDYLTAGSESQMSELLDQDSSSILLPESEEPVLEALDETTEESAEATTVEPYRTGDNIVSFANPSADEGAAQASAFDEQDFEDSILKDDAIDETLGRPDYDSVPAFRAEPQTQPAEEFSGGDANAFNFEAEQSPRRRDRFTLFWLIGSLLLILPLAGQLAWQFRDDLIQHPAGRQTLKLVCLVAGCEVPVRRALDKIVIQGRNLSTHPDKPDTLFLQVRIVNTAAFDQPFPQLTLSLYNDKGKVIARRTFSSQNYLPPAYKHRQLMPKAEPILVEMELVDPGKEVTGFSFDFF